MLWRQARELLRVHVAVPTIASLLIDSVTCRTQGLSPATAVAPVSTSPTADSGPTHQSGGLTLIRAGLEPTQWECDRIVRDFSRGRCRPGASLIRNQPRSLMDAPTVGRVILMRALRRSKPNDRAGRGDDGLTVGERSIRAKRYMRAVAGPVSEQERRVLAERLAARHISGADARGRSGGEFNPHMA